MSEWESYFFLSPFCFVSLISFSFRPPLSNKTHHHTHSYSHMMSGFFCTLLWVLFFFGEQCEKRSSSSKCRETFGWLKDGIYFHIVNAILLLSGVWISRLIFRSFFSFFFNFHRERVFTVLFSYFISIGLSGLLDGNLKFTKLQEVFNFKIICWSKKKLENPIFFNICILQINQVKINKKENLWIFIAKNSRKNEKVNFCAINFASFCHNFYPQEKNRRKCSEVSKTLVQAQCDAILPKMCIVSLLNDNLNFCVRIFQGKMKHFTQESEQNFDCINDT